MKGVFVKRKLYLKSWIETERAVWSLCLHAIKAVIRFSNVVINALWFAMQKMIVSAKKLLRKNADVEKTILHKSASRKSISYVRIYAVKLWTVASINAKNNAAIRIYIYAI